MFSGWFGGDKPAEAEPATSGNVFHEYPHPEGWKEAVDEVYSRLGNGDDLPLDMCPCGNKKATVRRFLVARKYKVDEAEKMIRDAIEWRKTCKVGDLVGVDAILKGKPRWDLLGENRKIIPNTPFLGYTKQGYPVYCLRLGKGDSNLAQTASEECHVYSTIIRGEHLMKQVVPEAEAKRVTDKAKRKAEGGKKKGGGEEGGEGKEGEQEEEEPEDDDFSIMDKQVVVIDLDGIGLSALRCLYVFKIINSVAAYNYPELSKAIYVLNSPSMFDYLWSAVKPLLAAHTQQKIRIFSAGPDQFKALRLIFEDDEIPDYLVPTDGSAGDVKGRAGCVTDVEGFLPDTVKAMDEWIKSQSDDP